MHSTAFTFNRNSMDKPRSTICKYSIFKRLYKHMPLYKKLRIMRKVYHILT
ncbi:conserved hypothetical protein, partial [Trichinella spiralis]|uniref:hypothetical protein n=1 Tax=Trichinella spiralis TaxID=6334 RepID=UPI0001EFE618